MTGAGCFLLVNENADDRCNQLNRLFYTTLIVERRIDRVILSHRWTTKSLPALKNSIDFLKARRVPVTVIGPIEEFDDSLPLLLANAIKAGDPSRVEKHRLAGPAAIDQLMARTVPAWGADYYSVRSVECSRDVCRYLTPEGIPIHFDYGHATQSGAEFLLRDLPRY